MFYRRKVGGYGECVVPALVAVAPKSDGAGSHSVYYVLQDLDKLLPFLIFLKYKQKQQ